MNDLNSRIRFIPAGKNGFDLLFRFFPEYDLLLTNNHTLVHYCIFILVGSACIILH